jgi:hypothetical protein
MWSWVTIGMIWIINWDPLSSTAIYIFFPVSDILSQKEWTLCDAGISCCKMLRPLPEARKQNIIMVEKLYRDSCLRRNMSCYAWRFSVVPWISWCQVTISIRVTQSDAHLSHEWHRNYVFGFFCCCCWLATCLFQCNWNPHQLVNNITLTYHLPLRDTIFSQGSPAYSIVAHTHITG